MFLDFPHASCYRDACLYIFRATIQKQFLSIWSHAPRNTDKVSEVHRKLFAE